MRGPVNSDDLTLVMHFACEGLGIAMLPATGAIPGLASGKLVPVLPQYQQHGSALYLVHPAQRHLPQRVGLLRDFLAEEIRKELVVCHGHAPRPRPEG